MEIKDINKIRNAAADPKAVIYVLATEELKKRIMNGSDPVEALDARWVYPIQSDPRKFLFPLLASTQIRFHLGFHLSEITIP